MKHMTINQSLQVILVIYVAVLLVMWAFVISQ